MTTSKSSLRRTVRPNAIFAAILALLAALSVSSAVAFADDGDAPAAPGTVRALRLTGVDGQVQVVQDGQVIADPAPDNLPLFEGSQVATGNDGRAEVQMEDGSIARLSPNTTVTFSVLAKQGAGTKTEIVLNRGLAYFELQASTPDHSLRVSFGNSSFTADSFAVIRVNQDVAPGELAVFSGNIELERGSALELAIHGGESLTMDATDLTRYNLSEAIDPDSWDNWNSDRDQLLTSESAERTAATGDFVNNQSVGMNDLDAYGNWYDVPGQGYVWSPFEATSGGDSWDPYGYGNWVQYPGSGYLWVSGYPWGFAPYQCGLWNFYDGFGWGWAPGMGCNPWYNMGGGGGGGWFFNIGTFPRGYRPPHRPLPNPVKPRPIGGPLRTASIIPVDRRPQGGPTEPGGRINHPVTIAGHTVEPLRPLAPRPVYDRAGNLSYSRAVGSHTPSDTYVSGSHTGANAGSYHPVYPTAGSSGSGAYHPQPHSYSPPSHASGGSGGGGGGSHASAPSGGGGGGGGHASGGGGGATHK